MSQSSIHHLAAAAVCALAVVLLAPAGASAAGLGKMCGGIAGIHCDAGLWCDYKPGTCGRGDAAGKCVKAPKICNKIFKPVCGCDAKNPNGKTYGNNCERQAAKVSLLHNGRCKSPKKPTKKKMK